MAPGGWIEFESRAHRASIPCSDLLALVFQFALRAKGNHGIPQLPRKNHTAGDGLFGVQGTSRAVDCSRVYHLADEAWFSDCCSVLPLPACQFAHMLLSTRERCVLIAGRAELIFLHHGKIYVQEAPPFNRLKPVREADFKARYCVESLLEQDKNSSLRRLYL